MKKYSFYDPDEEVSTVSRQTNFVSLFGEEMALRNIKGIPEKYLVYGYS